MIAYNRTLLDNLRIEKKAKRWFADGLITPGQMAAVQKNYPVNFYRPNIFIRVGLFIFMWIIITAALGFYSLFTLGILSHGSSKAMESYGLFSSVLFGGMSFFFLERFIRSKKWFGNGMDDALLYSGLGSVFSLLVIIMSDNWNDSGSIILFCALFLPVLLFAAARYLDRLVTLCVYVCFCCLFFMIVMETGWVAKFIMPFAFMVMSAGTYFLTEKLLRSLTFVHYKRCVNVIRAASLIVFYISGNYFVIRESSIEYFNLVLTGGQDIPLALLFYLFTALIPLAYLYVGLKRKDKLLVWVALLLIAISVLTFKYYFSLGHPEITLTLAGLIMIVLAYSSIRYLAEGKHGITFKDDPNDDDFLKSNAEALLIAGSFGTAQVEAQTKGPEFGGGQFGGAGSGGKY